MESKYENLEKLNDLLKKGIISETEYATEKQKVLGNTTVSEKKTGTKNNKSFSALMHLSQFANLILPPAGLVAPIVMWAARKDEDEFIDVNGKIILNWNISVLIYSSIATLILLIGGGFSIFATAQYENPVPFLGFMGGILIPIIIFGVADLIFTIIGAVKANNGEVWDYPLSIKFFKTQSPTSKVEI